MYAVKRNYPFASAATAFVACTILGNNSRRHVQFHGTKKRLAGAIGANSVKSSR